METITSSSNVRPPEHVPVVGPTVTLYRSNVVEETITPEEPEREPYTLYRYTELRFRPGEYELVRQGSLPVGADEWTDDLRSIERSFKYDQADVQIAKSSDYDTPEWAEYRDRMKAYKRAVRETASQPEYPETVSYPDMPTL